MSLSLLWGLINGLQVVVYLMLFNIPIPANVLILNSVFYEIATFDLIPLDWLTDYIDDTFGHLDNNGQVYLSAQALEVGYNRTNPIINLILPIFLILASLTLYFILMSLTSCKIRQCGNLLGRIHQKIKRSMFWNGFIRLFNEEYITITLACMIKAYTLDFSNYYEAFLSAISIFGMVLAIVFPLLVTKFLWRLHAMDPDIMKVDTFKFKWGELT